MYSVKINNFDEWRSQARELLKRAVPPEQIAWQTHQQTSLFENFQLNAEPSKLNNSEFLRLNIKTDKPSIPPDFITIAKKVACYRDDSRWSLLYAVAWRLIYENRELLANKIDSQVSKIMSMRKVIGREIHKMEAFVRFQKIIQKPINEGQIDQKVEQEEVFVAWFEPEHLILPAVTPFFSKRFNKMHWSILTPDLCAHWDQKQISFTQGLPRSPSVDDELEDLWRTYYANIFNPARIKLKAMQAEMPKKYWINLPEAPLIKELTRNAGNRVDDMLNEQNHHVWKKTAKSKFIKNKRTKS